MKACMCTRGKDFNGQLQFENSIFPRFGRSARSSEKLSAIAKNNFQKTKTTIVGKESEAITNAAVPVTAVLATTTNSGIIGEVERNGKNLTTTITIPNHIECKNINGIKEMPIKVQRTNEVLHTDL